MSSKQSPKTKHKQGNNTANMCFEHLNISEWLWPFFLIHWFQSHQGHLNADLFYIYTSTHTPTYTHHKFDDMHSDGLLVHVGGQEVVSVTQPLWTSVAAASSASRASSTRCPFWGRRCRAEPGTCFAPASCFSAPLLLSASMEEVEVKTAFLIQFVYFSDWRVPEELQLTSHCFLSSEMNMWQSISVRLEVLQKQRFLLFYLHVSATFSSSSSWTPPLCITHFAK